MRRDHVGRNPQDTMRFASNLRGIMRREGLTQMALSIRVGTTPGAVCLWCQGRSVPYATTLKRIALALNCSCDELLEGGGGMTDELKPCPFCGGSAELRYHPSSRRDPECRAWEAGCSICDARVGSTVYAIGKTKKEAIAAWNRRAK